MRNRVADGIIDQGVLAQLVPIIFPGKDVFTDSRKIASVKDPTTGEYLEVDVWVPSLSLGFEFQDPYHYVSTWYSHKPVEKIRERDNSKKKFMIQKAIRLIAVSCWWDGSLESLLATIYHECPDAVPITRLDPIPLNPPAGFFAEHELPGIGELSYPSFIRDPALVSNFSWWLGEKYDGIRYYWQPIQKKGYTKNANELPLRAKLDVHMPSVAIDGELWFGRNSFELTHPLVHGNLPTTNWELLRLVGFEEITEISRNVPYEVRYANLMANTSPQNPVILLPSRLALPHAHGDQLNTFAQDIIDNGGEGIMLQKLHAEYESGRSESILKFKMMLKDKEAIVVGKDHKAVHLKLPNGMVFVVPRENVHLSAMSVGDIVTFSCTIYNHRHVPVNPVIYRRRMDISWRDVMRLHMQEQQYLSASPLFSKSTMFSIEEMRIYMENFAKKKYLDPLVAETWYTIKDYEVYQFKKGRMIIKVFKNYASAVQQLFPDIDFDIKLLKQSTWKDTDSKRKKFEKYAKDNNFDPLVPENWYFQSKKKLLASPDVNRILGSYGNKHIKALVDVFPEIGLKKSDLTFKWHSKETRKSALMKFAQIHSFDPLVAANWYKISWPDFKTYNYARAMITYCYKKRYIEALMDLFPELDLKPTSFVSIPLGYWKDKNNRRELFSKIAHERGFDPLISTNWYPISYLSLVNVKGAVTILDHYYNGSIAKCVMDLFPNIGLVQSEFQGSKQWKSEAARRWYLKTLAQQNNFNLFSPTGWATFLEHKKFPIKISKTLGAIFNQYNTIADSLKSLLPEIANKKLPASLNCKFKRKK